ncbi:hypothetical protein EYZ11_000988 [Aspergillus tanneri]|uniref:Rhodopsin domain-containing protein n=1 Tax=Aspergillus tanneri TaxID=1220188 RepID=A0A4S3JVQ6_9EURO|nr:hypothetical protein EYZ11_000988 [Aspergillus tanneri]
MPLFSYYGDIPDSSAALSYPSLVFAILTPIVVAARLLGRHYLSGRLVCKWAFGKHEHDVPQELLIQTLKLYFVAQILYKINIGLTKISILLLYIRLFIQRWFFITCLTWVAIISSFTLSTVISSILQCSPVQYAFNKSIRSGGSCFNLTAFWYANAVFNIFSDLVLVALPVPVICKLHLPLKSKLVLCSIFAVGIFVCITSILRITTLDIATSHLDITWNSIGSSMWTVIESNLGIICACLPALRRPLAFVCPRLFGKLDRSAFHVVRRYEPPQRGSRSKTIDSGPNKSTGWSLLDELTTRSTVREGEQGGVGASQKETVSDPGVENQTNRIRMSTYVSVRYDQFHDKEDVVEMNDLTAGIPNVCVH